MFSKGRKNINFILPIAIILISIVSLLVFVWGSTLIGLILAIVSVVFAIATIMFILFSNEKATGHIVLSSIGCVMSVAVLIIAIVGTNKINDMKDKLNEENKAFLVNDNSDSYTQQIAELERLLEIQQTMDEYEDAVDRFEDAYYG